MLDYVRTRLVANRAGRACWWAIALTFAGAIAAASEAPSSDLHLDTGKEIWHAACAACHGEDGRGALQSLTVFQRPDTFPDFTRCDQTTAEDNLSYEDTVTNGGPARGFSPIMPAFRDALTQHQIRLVVEYLRGFCAEPRGWPRAELNAPRALVTEKAYPEDEVVITTTLNASGAPGVSNEIVDEQRFGKSNEVEISVPVNFADPDHRWYGGFGDAGIGIKRSLFASLRTGSILAVQAGVHFPTGNATRGLGSGAGNVELFAAYDQWLTPNIASQVQVGGEISTNSAVAPHTFYFRDATGWTWRAQHGLGRAWTPMLEWLADRSFVGAATLNWDIVPQLQVTLSRRQHVAFDAGYRIPVTNTAGRGSEIIFYLFWDSQDGKLTEGW